MAAPAQAPARGEGRTKVLYVLPFAQPGGAESMVLRLIRSLSETVEPSAVLLDDGPFAQALGAAGVPVDVVAMPGKRGILSFPAAARAVARRHPGVDAIHANGTKGALFGVLLARRLRVPLIWLKPDHFFDGRVARAVARRCDRVVCVSEAMAAQFGPALASRVSVAYPGVAAPERPTPLGDEPLIVSAGRLDPLKGFDDLIRAVGVLRDRGVDGRIRICGPPDRMHPRYERRLHDLIAELGLGERAEVLGWVEDYDEFLSSGRVLATASKPPAPGRPSEAAPTVLMEAMARARPVVAQREPGTVEVVGDGGALVDSPTPERLADALAPYLTDAALAAETGRRGRERVERLFDQRITTERFRAVYASVSG